MVCPVCSIAVGAGVGLSQCLGIDDTISGIWIGALIISSALWFIFWLEKRKIKFKFYKTIIFILFYLVFVLPLYWMDFIGNSCNILFGLNKLLLGIFFGSVVFYISVLFSNYLKKKNNNKVYFAYQKVIIPILFLIAASIVFYFIVRC
ncbi:MAG: hypothetical protein B6U87_01765 [Candidatus Aenigmarchaeota archaeon ex4484_52]|nr:MAG: hypothetical protein B6U87_01765 [Candidatus Aenigmarchaeota archaeon ex4484_52]